jgi:hypothetical protein
VKLVYIEGWMKKDAGAVMGLRDFNVTRKLQRVTRLLRAALEAADPGDWTGVLTRIWEECLDSCWENVQVSPASASEGMSSGGR